MSLLRVIESFKSQTFLAQLGDLSEGGLRKSSIKFLCAKPRELSSLIISALNSKEKINVY
jgi:hypothetical protein